MFLDFPSFVRPSLERSTSQAFTGFNVHDEVLVVSTSNPARSVLNFAWLPISTAC
jgi:hypothetical protein